MLYMRFYCIGAYVQGVADFVVAVTFDNQVQDIQLTVGEQGVVLLVLVCLVTGYASGVVFFFLLLIILQAQHIGKQMLGQARVYPEITMNSTVHAVFQL